MNITPPLTLNAWLRYDLIWRQVRKVPEGAPVLEVGPGGCAMGVRLARRHEYTAVEMDDVSYRTAERRLAAAGQGRVFHSRAEELDDGLRFDLLCAFEVLEHIEDDVAALQGWRDRLRPGGRVLLSVPAKQARFGPQDVMAGHFRRYEVEGLRDLLHAQGFTDAQVWIYGFPLGYALELARNLVARRRDNSGSMHDLTGGSGRLLQPPDWLGPLMAVAVYPFRLVQRPFFGSRWGTGLVATAVKPGRDDG